MAQRKTPPFRADHVGSLLRTAPLKQARAQRAKGEIDAAALHSGRGPRDRDNRQEAARGRPQARDRRRIPPLLVAFRFLLGLAGRRKNQRAADQIPRRRYQGRGDQDRRQNRFRRPPADRALQVPESTLPHHAENVHPGAVHFPFPPGPRDGEQGGLSRLRRILRRHRRRLEKGDPRLLRRRLPLSAARRHRLGDDLRSARARAIQSARRRPRQAAGDLCARDQ